jgi:hypothetical protein
VQAEEKGQAGREAGKDDRVVKTQHRNACGGCDLARHDEGVDEDAQHDHIAPEPVRGLRR